MRTTHQVIKWPAIYKGSNMIDFYAIHRKVFGDTEVLPNTFNMSSNVIMRQIKDDLSHRPNYVNL